MFSIPIRHSPLLDCLAAVCDCAYPVQRPNLRAALQTPRPSNVKRRLGRRWRKWPIFAPDLTMPNSCVPRRHRRTSTISISPHMKRLRALAKLDPASRSAPSLSSPKPVGEQSLFYRKLRAGPSANDWLAADGARLLNPNSSPGDRCFNPSPARCRLDAGKAEHDRPHRER
jgi:hypothetical protein